MVFVKLVEGFAKFIEFWVFIFLSSLCILAADIVGCILEVIVLVAWKVGDNAGFLRKSFTFIVDDFID
jgi:hypothetical protein